MPVGFWNDPDGANTGRRISALRQHLVPRRLLGDHRPRRHVIYGRSDATLNPGGVRIGTAEIYRQVERLEGGGIPGDRPAVAAGRRRRAGGAVRQAARGLSLDDALIARIRDTIRDNTTPRHVPARVVQVADIPRTKSGKIVELAVRAVVHGEPVKNVEALANPAALEHFRARPELQS
jgi:acetoacetyl-CoA synthetase